MNYDPTLLARLTQDIQEARDQYAGATGDSKPVIVMPPNGLASVSGLRVMHHPLCPPDTFYLMRRREAIRMGAER